MSRHVEPVRHRLAPTLVAPALVLLVVLAAAITAPAVAFAQPAASPCRIAPGQPAVDVRGTVIDPSGAAVPGAVVIAECGDARVEGTTNDNGQYVLALAPGSYVLQVLRPGFEPAARDVTIGAAAARLDAVTLAVAAFTDSVSVVSAAAVERSLRDAPASISVVTAADLAVKPFRDLSEALATVEGVTARRSGNLNAGIQVRGLDSAYTLMLIDGKRVNATSASFRGNDYDTGWVPPDAIERVEVVRGPMSSLYGSDAIGGVVNIITRRVGTRWTGSASTSGTFQENRDAGDTYIANAWLAGPLVPDVLGLKLYGGYDRRGADGTINPPPATGGAAQPGFPVNDNRYMAGDLRWLASRGNDITFHADGSRRDHGGFLLKRRAASVEHKGTWGTRTSEVRIYGDEIRNLVGTVTGQINPNTATSAVAEGRLNLPFSRHVVTVGGQWRRETLDDPANLAGLPGTPSYGVDPTTSIRQAAAFAEADFALGSRLRLTLGNRFDHHENFGGTNSPRIYAVYHLGASVTAKAGVARAFRAPTLLQNSPTWGSPSCGNAVTGCFIVGSLELDPETSTSVEAGLQFDRGPWSGGVTYFRNDLRNMIDITNRTNNAALAPTFPNFIGFLPDGPPGYGRAIFRYQNIAVVRTDGVETSLRYSPTATLRLRANYGYLRAENRSGAVALPLVYRPEHTVNAAVDWTPLEALTLAGIVRANSSQYLNVPPTGTGLVSRDGYGVVDLTAAVRVRKALILRGGVLNVADMTLDRTTALDFNEDGRRFFAGLSLRF